MKVFNSMQNVLLRFRGDEHHLESINKYHPMHFLLYYMLFLPCEELSWNNKLRHLHGLQRMA